ncbi:MAG: ABC transporter substrate-binding protein [Chloroflexota bacterium]
MKRMVYIATILFCLCSILLSGWKTGSLFYTLHRRRDQAFAYGQQQAARVQEEINAEFIAQMNVADAIANDLTSGALPYENLSARLREEVQRKPNMYGIGAAFEPYRYSASLELFGPCYYKDDTGKFIRTQVEETDFYTDRSNPNNAWYYQTVEEAQAHWYVYDDATTRSTQIEYAVPFFLTDPATQQKTVAGVVYIDHSLDTIKQFMRSIDVGREGYTSLIADTGLVIVHPKTVYVNKTVAEIVHEFKLPETYIEDNERASAGEAVDVTGISVAGGDAAWRFSRPLVAQGWVILIVIKQNANEPTPEWMVRELLWIGLLLSASILGLAALLFLLKKGQPKSWWRMSVTAAIVLIAYVAYTWAVIHTYPPRPPGENILVNAANVDEVIDPIDTEAAEASHPAPIRIPTGVLIKTLSVDPLSATVSGYVWQKYPVQLSASVTRGIRFPDDLSGASLEEVYRFTKGDVETVGWFFIVTVQQTFDMYRYPLDQANILIKILPAELDDNLLLVPDLDSYEWTAPNEQPGLVSNLDLSGWNIQRSYFSFTKEAFNTDLGSATFVQQGRLPTLAFNVNATRNLLSPLIAYCITAVVVASMLFGIQMVDIETPYNVLANASALFFIVAITHVGLRGALNTSGVVYLEYIFILQYVFVLLGAVNGLLYYGSKREDWIHYQNNLIPRLAYWPVFLVLLIAVTLGIFYPPYALEDSTDTSLAVNQAPRRTSTPYITPTTPADQANTPSATGEAAALPPPSGVRARAQTIERTNDSVTLRYPIYSAPTTFDPSLSNRYDSTEQIGNLFVGLTRLDAETLEPVPSLATAWETSEDGLTWTFSLRSDIPWVQYTPDAAGGKTDKGTVRQVTDRQGNPLFVTATDVVYGIQRALLSKNPSAQLLFVIQNAEEVFNGAQAAEMLGVHAIDAATLEITLESPAPYLPSLLAYDIAYAVPRWSVEEWADLWTSVGYINTNGPYLLAGFNSGQGLTLTKNPFWPEADQVQIEWIEEPLLNAANFSAILQMYRNNELDTVGNPTSEMVEAIQSNATLTKDQVTYPRLCTQYIGFVNTKAPFNDVRVRRAFSAAIDREYIVEQVLRNGSLPAQVLAPPGVFGAATDPSAGQGYDPLLAQSLFKEFLGELGMTVEEFNTAYPLQFGQLSSGNAVNRAIVAGWKEVLDVEVELITAPNDDLSPYDRKNVPVEKVFHMFQGNWCADYPDQDNFVRFLFNAQNGSNGVRRNCADANCNQVNAPGTFDTLTLEASSITDPDQRRERYAQAEQILAVDEAAYAPLFFEATTAITKAWLVRHYPSFGPPDFSAWVIDSESQVIP